MDETEQVDEQFRAWLRTLLTRAADQFGLVLSPTAAVHYGWRLRSVSTHNHSKPYCRLHGQPAFSQMG